MPEDRVHLSIAGAAAAGNRTRKCRAAASICGRRAAGTAPQGHDALARVGLATRAQHWPNQLSGGEQQRTVIARAIVNDPALILADEPTGALDSATAGEILSIFEGLHRDGRTIVMVTHAADVAARALTPDYFA